MFTFKCPFCCECIIHQDYILRAGNAGRFRLTVFAVTLAKLHAYSIAEEKVRLMGEGEGIRSALNFCTFFICQDVLKKILVERRVDQLVEVY